MEREEGSEVTGRLAGKGGGVVGSLAGKGKWRARRGQRLLVA